MKSVIDVVDGHRYTIRIRHGDGTGNDRYIPGALHMSHGIRPCQEKGEYVVKLRINELTILLRSKHITKHKRVRTCHKVKIQRGTVM